MGKTELNIPEAGAVFTFGRSSFAENRPSTFWVKNDRPVRVSCGGGHSGVITEKGRLLMFGVNTCGQLGLGFKPTTCKPASVKALKSEKVKLVACGTDHTIACTWRGAVYGAGGNQEGQLGLGHCDNTASFQLLHPFCEQAPVKMLSAGCNTSAALTEDGRLFMWGDNSLGQIGLGDELLAAEPRELDVGEAVTWVSCGSHHSAFVTAAGDLYTFGESANGRLGLRLEQLANHRVPQRVQGVPGRVVQVCCGGEHTVVLTEEEQVFTFGRGQHGQLGHGTFLFEVHLPKPLEHFSNCGIRHVTCGENNTGVVTDSGLLYTFGDGRHGKLGLGEENFINHFSPTLCTRFLKYSVQLVSESGGYHFQLRVREGASCGGNHMLVMAEPRPPDNQEVPPEKDAKAIEDSLDSNCTEILLLDSLYDPSSVVTVPHGAPSARARHREKECSVESFGEMFQNLPRLSPGLHSTSRHKSRNIPDHKPPSIGSPNPPSPPRSLSEVTPSPPVSPRSPSKSPENPVLSSKPSSPGSRPPHNKTSGGISSKSKQLPSALLSPKSVTNPKVTVPRKNATKKRAHETAASRLSPKEPCSPIRPPSDSNKHLSEEELPASQKTGGDPAKTRITIEDMEISAKEVKRDFLPNTEKKKGRELRRAVKESSAFSEPFVSSRKAEHNLHKSLPTELLRGSGSLKTVSKKPKVTSKGKENVTKQSDKITTQINRQAQKGSSQFKAGTRNHKSSLAELSPKAAQSAGRTQNKPQQGLSEVKENARTNRKSKHTNSKQRNDSFQKDLIQTTGTLEEEESAVTEATNAGKMLSVSVRGASPSSAESAAEEESNGAEIQIKSADVKEGVQQEARQKDQRSKGQKKAADVKTSGGGAEKTVKSPALKVKGKPQEVKSTPVEGRRDKTTTVKSDKKPAKNELGVAAETKGRGGDKQKLLDDDKEKKVTKESKLKVKGQKEEEAVKDDKKMRTQVAAAAASDQGSFDSDTGDIPEERRRWGETLSAATAAASLLPAVAAAGVLGEAVTSVRGFLSDSDTAASTPRRARQFTKQSAVTQPSASSFDMSSTADESRKEDAPVRREIYDVTLEQSEQDVSESGDSSMKHGDTNTETSQQGRNDEDEDDDKTWKASEESEDSKGDTEDEERREDEESGSEVEDEEGKSEVSSNLEDEEESDSGEAEEEEAAEEEETRSGSEEEAEASDTSSAAGGEGEEEERDESSGDESKRGSDSEAAEEEGSESEDESSKAESSDEDKSEEEDKEESETKDSDTSSASSEEEEEKEVDTESEEEGDDSESTKSEEEEEDSGDEGTGDSDEEEDTEKQDEVSSDNDQEEEEDKSSDTEAGEEEATADESSEQGSQEEEEEGEEEEEEGDEEASADESSEKGTAEEEEEEASADDSSEKGTAEEEEEGEEDEEEASADDSSEKGTAEEEEEGEEDEEEASVDDGSEKGTAEEEEEGEEDEEEASADEGDEKEATEEEEEEGDDEEESSVDEGKEEEGEEEEEEEGEEEGEKSEEEASVVEGNEREDEEEDDEEEEEEEEEAEEEEEDGGAKKEITEEEEEEEEEGEEDEEEEESENDEAQKINKKVTVEKEEEDEEEGEEEEEEEEDEEEEEETQSKQGTQTGLKKRRDEEKKKQQTKKQKESESEEEEEGEEEEEEEEEESAAEAPKKAERENKEKPKPAPRTKARASEEEKKKPDDPQEFWNDVLPQYLDLQ